MFTNFENMPQQTDKAIKFFFPAQGITLRNRNKLKDYLRSMLKKEGKKLDYLNYIFCSDDYLLEINKQYLQHDYYTDIITFDLSSDSSLIEAEIYISVDRVRDNSHKHHTTIQEEMYRVIFHGILHLCGYTDKTEGEKARMRAKEDYYLKNYTSSVSRDTVSGRNSVP